MTNGATFFVFLLFLPPLTETAPVASTEGGCQRERFDIERAESAAHLAEAYSSFANRHGPTKLQSLFRLSEVNTSLALQGAWNLYGRNRLGDQTEGSQQVVKLERFLGVVEGRVKSALPEWWSSILLESTYSHGDFYSHLTFPKALSMQSSERGAERTAGYESHGGLSIAVSSEVFILKKEARELRVARATLAKAGAEFFASECSALFGRDRVYVVLYRRRASPCMLLCYDAASGRLLWKCNIWALGGTHGTGPESTGHIMEILETSDEVVVFGADYRGMYLEGYQADTGKFRYAFSTLYGK